MVTTNIAHVDDRSKLWTEKGPLPIPDMARSLQLALPLLPGLNKSEMKALIATRFMQPKSAIRSLTNFVFSFLVLVSLHAAAESNLWEDLKGLPVLDPDVF